MNPPFPTLLQFLLLALALFAAGFDLKSRRIPNWLTATGFVGGFVLQTASRKTAGFRDATAGAALAFGIYFILFALRALGAGDVKLMTATGAIVGPSNWLIIFVISALAGGVLAVLLTLGRGTLLSTVSRVREILGSLLRGRGPFRRNPTLDAGHPQAITLPHAVPIAIGCIAYLVASKP